MTAISFPQQVASVIAINNMPKDSIDYCDICEMDGDDHVIAIAEYKAKDEKFYFVCKKHFEDVKEAGLYYKFIYR